MTRHYNVSHKLTRGRGHYGDRLARRGLAKSPRMEPLDALRKRQGARVRNTCTVGTDHERHECNGSPWPTGAELATMPEAEPAAA